MKTSLICLIVFVSAFVSVRAQDILPDYANLSLSYRSQYVYRNANVGSEDPVMFPNLWIGYDNGMFVNVFASLPTDLSRVNEDYATELYYTTGWSGNVNGYKLSLSLSFDDIYPVMSLDKSDLVIANVHVSRTFAKGDVTLTPYVDLESDFSFDGVHNGEIIPRVGADITWMLSDRLSCAAGAYLLYDSGVSGGTSGVVAGLDASVNLKITERLKWNVLYVEVRGPVSGCEDRETHTTAGTGLSFSW